MKLRSKWVSSVLPNDFVRLRTKKARAVIQRYFLGNWAPFIIFRRVFGNGPKLTRSRGSFLQQLLWDGSVKYFKPSLERYSSPNILRADQQTPIHRLVLARQIRYLQSQPRTKGEVPPIGYRLHCLCSSACLVEHISKLGDPRDARPAAEVFDSLRRSFSEELYGVTI